MRLGNKEVMMTGRPFAYAAILAAATLCAAPAGAYEVITVTDGGTLAGTVKATGAGAPGKIEVSKDSQVCGTEKMAPDLVVGADGALANVVVVVKAAKGKKMDVPAQNPVFDQKTCEFHPHILVFPAGSTIDILNSDGILHNVHTTSSANPSVNQAQPKFKPKINVKVEKPEWPIAVKCDVHGWMSGYWISQEHPYYALTDASGAFKIGDLPPGDYEVEVWHEKLGKKTEKVTIKPGEETTVSWSLGS